MQNIFEGFRIDFARVLWTKFLRKLVCWLAVTLKFKVVENLAGLVLSVLLFLLETILIAFIVLASIHKLRLNLAPLFSLMMDLGCEFKKPVFEIVHRVYKLRTHLPFVLPFCFRSWVTYAEPTRALFVTVEWPCAVLLERIVIF